jgi:adenine-specific DNA methylase
MSSQLQRSNKNQTRTEDRRLIEDSFPIKEVSAESVREKNIRQGHIATLHVWWARRPLASSRATSFAALVSATKSRATEGKTRDFIVKLSKWENSFDDSLLIKARRSILESNLGRPPKVLDLFAGGGAIPLESLRLGCETYASDYNPVAVLILKCTLEYPMKYGDDKRKKEPGIVLRPQKNKLLEDVRKWGNHVLADALRELRRFYPVDEDGSTPVGYIWAHTIPCQNPSCNAEIPLVGQYWLSINEDKSVALHPFVEGRSVKFEIVGREYKRMPKDFDPASGSVSGAIARCLVCGFVVDDKTVPQLFKSGKSYQRLLAVILHKEGTRGKKYRIADEKDWIVFKNAEDYLHKKIKELSSDWGVSPIPDEPLPPIGTLGFRVQRYNMLTWGDLFNSRQKLALIVFTEKVRKAHSQMLDAQYEKEYARAVTSYLALGVDRLAVYGSILCLLNPTGGRGVNGVFGRQTVQMVWDYAESNPFNPVAAGWPTACEKNEKWIEHASSVSSSPATVYQGSAISVPYADNFFDAVFTDPPYYDNVPYSHLSDFFYVWLKRMIGDLYPDLFATPLSPKSEEIVAYSHRPDGLVGGKEFFENMLEKSFVEIRRVLKPNGISTIVYAHKSTAGWETLINSLLDSGLVVTASWPIHTERRGRRRSQGSAALASSIYMVARKVTKEQVGFYNEVKESLDKHLKHKLDLLWYEHISGGDFFIAAIGTAVEIFGKYERVIDDEGNLIRGDRLLEDVRRIATDYAVRQVLHDGIAGEVTPMTRFYVLWRWAYGEAKLEFDDARKLAQGVGISLDQNWNRGFVLKDKEFIELLGPQQRELGQIEGPLELIDVLHRVLLLWEKGKNDEIVAVLKETGLGDKDVFYRVAQAIVESLGSTSKEKKLLEGFLQGRQRISQEIRMKSEQTKLFE